MICKVIGLEKKNYTSKTTGKPVQGTNVHVSHEAYNVEGEAAEAVWVSPAKEPKEGLAVGLSYNFDFDPKGHLVGIRAVKG